jgi:hypothetical protein
LGFLGGWAPIHLIVSESEFYGRRRYRQARLTGKWKPLFCPIRMSASCQIVIVSCQEVGRTGVGIPAKLIYSGT